MSEDDKLLQVQIAMLREALRQYGQHEEWCYVEDQRELAVCRLKGKEPLCSCGYDWLLSRGLYTRRGAPC